MVAKKRYDEARKAFAVMAKWNGAEFQDWDEVIFEKEAEDAEKPVGFEEEEERNKPPAVNWRDIWAVPVLRTNLWSAAILYVEATFNFYLLTFYLKYFPGNVFENSVFFACSDLLAFVLAGASLNYMGMKFTIRIAATLALIGGVSYMIFYNQEDLVPYIICASRVG